MIRESRIDKALRQAKESRSESSRKPRHFLIGCGPALILITVMGITVGLWILIFKLITAL